MNDNQLINNQKKIMVFNKKYIIILSVIIIIIIAFTTYIAFSTIQEINKPYSLSSLRKDALSATDRIEAEYYSINSFGNIFRTIEPEYVFDKDSENYYINSTLSKKLELNPDIYVFTDVKKSNTLDASIITYNATTQVFNICLVIDKKSKAYSKKYATKEVTHLSDITIPAETMYICGYEQNSWNEKEYN